MTAITPKATAPGIAWTLWRIRRKGLTRWIGQHIARIGSRMGRVERYGADCYAVSGGESCHLCRYCGRPTQTTDRACWYCR